MVIGAAFIMGLVEAIVADGRYKTCPQNVAPAQLSLQI